MPTSPVFGSRVRRDAHGLAALLTPLLCIAEDPPDAPTVALVADAARFLLGLPADLPARLEIALPGLRPALLPLTPEADDAALAGGTALGLLAGADDRSAGVLRVARRTPEAFRAVHVTELALDLALDRIAAQEAERRVTALDAATAATVAELSLERVLQVIVDEVRPLVGARYAALATTDARGRIDRFITSGMDDATRRAIGHIPRGLGILGVVVTEGRTIRLADLMADPRAAGFPGGHPPMHAFLGVPVRVEGRPIGNLYLTEKRDGADFDAEDEEIVESFARHAGIAIRNARLHAELGRLAVVEERERIGADLHDGIIQSLYAVGLSLEDLGEEMREDPESAERRIEQAIDAIHGTIRDIRNFIFGLRPEVLGDVELVGAIEALADEFRRGSAVDLRVDAADDVEVDGEVAVQLVQLTREALSNVARHAGARNAIVELSAGQGILTLVIGDDGRGFDPQADHGPAHRGVVNMRARAESIGGTLEIASVPGDGTRVVLRLPVGDR